MEINRKSVLMIKATTGKKYIVVDRNGISALYNGYYWFILQLYGNAKLAILTWALVFNKIFSKIVLI